MTLYWHGGYRRGKETIFITAGEETGAGLETPFESAYKKTLFMNAGKDMVVDAGVQSPSSEESLFVGASVETT